MDCRGWCLGECGGFEGAGEFFDCMEWCCDGCCDDDECFTEGMDVDWNDMPPSALAELADEAG